MGSPTEGASGLAEGVAEELAEGVATPAGLGAEPASDASCAGAAPLAKPIRAAQVRRRRARRILKGIRKTPSCILARSFCGAFH